MTKRLSPRLVPCLVYLTCAYWVLRDPYRLAGSEFGGGWLTGKLLDLNFGGAILFSVAALLIIVSRRLSAAAAVLSSTICLPLYLQFVFPRMFRTVFRGDWSDPTIPPRFVADRWALESLLVLAVAVSVSIYVLCMSSTAKVDTGSPAV